jgi:hypothetical protein
MVMKRLLLLFVVLMAVVTSMGQGWREGEKQIIATFHSKEEAHLLSQFKINFEIVAEDKARAYVTNSELNLLE